MNKNSLIKIQDGIRERKDASRKILYSKTQNTENDNTAVFPQSVYVPCLYTNVDQWYFNGFLLKLENQLVVVDPGVDFYSRFTTTGYSFGDITSIILTHNHIDHSASISVFLEKVLKYKNNTLRLFISKEAFGSKVPQYLKDEFKKEENKNKLFLLEDKDKKPILISLGEYIIEFQPLYHSCPDTFGFKIKKNEVDFIGYISDTGYAKEVRTGKGTEAPESTTGEFFEIVSKHDYIKTFFSGCINLIVNINDLGYNRHSKYHLSGWDVLDICKDTKIQKVILQHLAPVNVDGEDSNYLYKLFFVNEEYEILLPHYMGRIISI